MNGKPVPLSAATIANLRAGRPVSIFDDKTLVRVNLEADPAVDAGAPAPAGMLAFAARRTSQLPVGPGDLDTAGFYELCDTVFEGIPSSRFSWVAGLSPRDKALLSIRCRRVAGAAPFRAGAEKTFAVTPQARHRAGSL